MSSVDDRLREAFGTADDEWVRRAPAAHGELRARHRRHQLVRLGVGGCRSPRPPPASPSPWSAVTPAPRTIQPAVPTPTTSTSTRRRSAPHRSRGPGSPVPCARRTCGRPRGPRVTRAPPRPCSTTSRRGASGWSMVVRGSSLDTCVRSAGAEDAGPGQGGHLDDRAGARAADRCSASPAPPCTPGRCRGTRLDDDLPVDDREARGRRAGRGLASPALRHGDLHPVTAQAPGSTRG